MVSYPNLERLSRLRLWFDRQRLAWDIFKAIRQLPSNAALTCLEFNNNIWVAIGYNLDTGERLIGTHSNVYVAIRRMCLNGGLN